VGARPSHTRTAVVNTASPPRGEGFKGGTFLLHARPLSTDEFMKRIAVDWPRTLELVLARAREHGRRGLVAFDLDSTVFDNRPRQARIVREFGAAFGVPALTRCLPQHFVSGWSLRAAALALGVAEADFQRFGRELKAFWFARFFTSEYCREDIEVVGAPRYLQAVAATGVGLTYVTGRHEAMREGTLACLAKCGMPVPGQRPGVGLLMKPSLHEDDDAYKLAAHAVLAEAGTLLAAFDNEPTHVNAYAQRFPEALAVHLATDHSERPVELKAEVISIPHFAW
jgi:hypothetical protein